MPTILHYAPGVAIGAVLMAAVVLALGFWMSWLEDRQPRKDRTEGFGGRR